MSQLKQLPQAIRINGGIAIAGALAIMLMQWGIEVVKWKRMFSGSFAMQWQTAFRAVFSGLAVSMITPNRVGEFAGRIMYLPAELRIKGTAFTFISNLAQLLVTLAAGSLALFFGGDIFSQEQAPPVVSTAINLLYWLTPVMTILTGIVFFSGSRWLGRLKDLRFLSGYRNQIGTIDSLSRHTLLEILFWSVCRYLLFIVQYGILFALSGDFPDPIHVFLCVSMFFLWLAVIPTLALAELGIRWQLAYWLFAPLLVSYPVILFAVTTVWTINFVLPAGIGALILLFYKPFVPTVK